MSDPWVFWVAVWAGYFVVIPAATFLSWERGHRLRWVRQTRVLRDESGPGAPLRTAAVDAQHEWRGFVVERRGAPTVVKVVATTSLVLGHMFVPGLLAALAGFLFYGVGLLAVPGLVLAARIYSNAFGLLRCELDAALQAQELQRFAVRLNVVILVAVAVWVVCFGLDFVPIVTASYAMISLLHAHGLGLAADEISAALHRD